MKLEKETQDIVLDEEAVSQDVVENVEEVVVGHDDQAAYKSIGKFKKILRRVLLNRQIYLMLLPVMIFYIVYNYMPMYGITLAWKEYFSPKFGIENSPWADPLWSNFEYLFDMPDLPRAIENTLKISALRLIIVFPVPILFSLLLNEIHAQGFKKAIQTMIYLPNFISWVILGGLVKILLASDGMFNQIVGMFGGEPIIFLQQPDMFYTILLLVEIWKGTGWGTIIYGASIAGIDANLYEAAKIDGCKRAGLMFRITLPLLMPIIAVMFVNQLSNIMNAGFDPVYNLYNKTIYDTADIIDTYSYRLFMEDHNYTLSSAVGIFKTSINFVLLIVGNYITKKISGYSMFSID